MTTDTLFFMDWPLLIPIFSVDASNIPDTIPVKYTLYFKKNGMPSPKDYDWMKTLIFFTQL